MRESNDKSCERDKKESRGLGEYEPTSTNASVQLGARVCGRGAGETGERIRGGKERDEKSGMVSTWEESVRKARLMYVLYNEASWFGVSL